jgi:hypothetical protein
MILNLRGLVVDLMLLRFSIEAIKRAECLFGDSLTSINQNCDQKLSTL